MPWPSATAGSRYTLGGMRTRLLTLSVATLAALTMAVGWGRSGFGPGAVMVGRYATLAAPVALWIYLAWFIILGGAAITEAARCRANWTGSWKRGPASPSSSIRSA